MKVAAVNLSLSEQFKDMGHDVLELKPSPGIFVISDDPAVRAFNPDILIQQETLGPRVLLAGMETLKCPGVYWSIDTHLNFFWHRLYARNFDLVLTTQKSWTEKFEKSGSKNSKWLPWFGRERPWIPWDQRDKDISFVGRITEYREVRSWMAEFLRDYYQVIISDHLSFEQMLDLYSRTRIVPNESIAGEVNFRIFEASSCGALVLNQKLTEGISELYEPDREIILFEHVLELKEKLDFYRHNPGSARRIAFNGWDITRKKHLPRQRALEMASFFPMERVKRNSAAMHKNLFLSVFELWECQRLKMSEKQIRDMILSLPIDEEVLTVIIRLHKNNSQKMTDFLIPILQQKQYENDLMVNMTCSVAALDIGRLDLACQFWKRYLLSRDRVFCPADSALQLYLLWAKELIRKGQGLRQGFMFDHKQHLPQSGMECLVMASLIEPDSKEILLNIKRLVQRQPGLESLVLRIVSRQSLKERNNWRWNLELALYHLKSFRIRAGLEELLLGEENAWKNNETGIFMDMLAARDVKGYLRNYLGRAGPR